MAITDYSKETQFKSGVQAVENGRKGGIASGKAKREARETKEILEIFMTMPLKKGKPADIDAIKNFMDMKGKNVTVKEAMAMQLIQMGLKGNLKAMEMALALMGDKPAEKVQLEANINPMAELTTEELRKLIAQHDTE